MIFPSPTIEIAWFNLIVGNLLLMLLNALAIWRRRMYSLIPLMITVPVYWFLASVASYRALHQPFFNPSQLEKTEHGISNVFAGPVSNKQNKAEDMAKNIIN